MYSKNVKDSFDIYINLPKSYSPNKTYKAFYYLDANIKSGNYEDSSDSDIVIITSGIGRKPGQSRLELVQKNIDILKK